MTWQNRTWNGGDEASFACPQQFVQELENAFDELLALTGCDGRLGKSTLIAVFHFGAAKAATISAAARRLRRGFCWASNAQERAAGCAWEQCRIVAELYPKSFSEVDSVVLPSKDTSFMDRMYMKLEAICVEADKNPSLLFQEASKYVESQVTTAGANMRKICSELIRDLLPPPDELSEGKNFEERKCQCMREREEKKAKQVKNSTMQQLGSAGVKGELCEAQCISSENVQEVDDGTNASSAGHDTKRVAEAAESIEAESDTEVEAGDQKAQWYVSDEYRRISGIGVMENLGGDTIQQVTSSKDELEAEWELL